MSGSVATTRISNGWMLSPSTSSLPPLLRNRFNPPPPSRREESSKKRHVGEEEEKSGLLKKKRPARLEIPTSAVVEDCYCALGRGADAVEEEGEVFSVYCKRGRRRRQMEDRYAAAVDMVRIDTFLHVKRLYPRFISFVLQAFFGVFDGHGGAGAAEFVSRNIDWHVMREMGKAGDSAAEMIEAVEAGYMKTDLHLRQEEVGGGACSVTALIKNHRLVVSNAGDCRAVISRSGTAEALTSDHTPFREDERDRIERLGGYVDCYHGVWRVQGSLAVSRGFGDSALKEYVTAAPETEVVRLEEEHEFVIMASDGLWDAVSNQEAVDVARPICIGEGSALPACKQLAELAVSRGSDDDVSVMIIVLKTFLRRT